MVNYEARNEKQLLKPAPSFIKKLSSIKREVIVRKIRKLGNISREIKSRFVEDEEKISSIIKSASKKKDLKI